VTHPKSALNAYCQSKGLSLPKFETRGTGTEDDPLFISDVTLDGELLATGQGRSKREAEKVAAELALELLKRTHGEPQTKNRKRRRKPRGGLRPGGAHATTRRFAGKFGAAHDQRPVGR